MPGTPVVVTTQVVDPGLQHVLDDGVTADAVAVDGEVPDGHLALVAGGEHHPAELVRHRHQGGAADAALQVLLGDVRRSLAERRRERAKLLQRRLADAFVGGDHLVALDDVAGRKVGAEVGDAEAAADAAPVAEAAPAPKPQIVLLPKPKPYIAYVHRSSGYGYHSGYGYGGGYGYRGGGYGYRGGWGYRGWGLGPGLVAGLGGAARARVELGTPEGRLDPSEVRAVWWRRPQAAATWRHPRGQRRHAHRMHVVLDGLARALLRRLEQRADVDVEAEIGEGGGDHLLAAVVAVLAHLGDQDARAAAVGFFGLLMRGGL